MAETIGQVIKRTREARGLSQQDLADKAGINVNWVKQIESGRIDDPGLMRTKAVCVVLGLDINKLTEGADGQDTALQIGTEVMAIMDKVSIRVPVVTSSDCTKVIATMRLPVFERTEMLQGHSMMFMEVTGKDCLPFAADGEVLLIATDIKTPKDGMPVVFLGDDKHCHVGTYHPHGRDGSPSVLVVNGTPPFDVAPDDIRGPVVWRLQEVAKLN